MSGRSGPRTSRPEPGGPPGAIRTARLDLTPLRPAFLEATVDGDLLAARTLLGADVPADWLDAADLAALRLRQLVAEPALQPWLLRAIVERETEGMIGFGGFHGPPGAPHLDEWLPGAAELGLTVFEQHRRRGFARETAVGLMDWATAEHGVRGFVVTVAPDNTASQALVAGLGFRRLGSWVDPDDGPEDVLGLEP